MVQTVLSKCLVHVTDCSLLDRQVETVQVTTGEHVAVLPFKTTPTLPDDVTVEWTYLCSRPMTVLVYQNQKNPNTQDQVYRGRTEMKEDLLRTGDLSDPEEPLL